MFEASMTVDGAGAAAGYRNRASKRLKAAHRKSGKRMSLKAYAREIAGGGESTLNLAAAEWLCNKGR